MRHLLGSSASPAYLKQSTQRVIVMRFYERFLLIEVYRAVLMITRRIPVSLPTILRLYLYLLYSPSDY